MKKTIIWFEPEGLHYKRVNSNFNLKQDIQIDFCAGFNEFKQRLRAINANRLIGVYLDYVFDDSQNSEFQELLAKCNIHHHRVWDVSKVIHELGIERYSKEMTEKIEVWALQGKSRQGSDRHHDLNPEFEKILNISKIACVVFEYTSDHVWLSEKLRYFLAVPADKELMLLDTFLNFFDENDRETIDHWIVNLKEHISENVWVTTENEKKNIFIEGLNYTANSLNEKKIEKILIFQIENEVVANVHDFAHFDVLTGLPNRYLFYDRLKIAIANSKRRNNVTAVLMLDLDHFKRVNDVLGYECGDQLLKEIAKLLKYAVRETDTIARIGGNEFMFILTDLIRAQNAIFIANKVLGYFSKPFKLAERDVFISASIGISFFPEDTNDLDSLIKNADMAMHRAKNQGRNNYQLYSPEMNSRAFEQLSLESSLRKAIQNEEFTLYFQPQINVVTKQIVGAEALVRWQHPDLGIIGPDIFIPLAEETGLIIPLGEWILKQAVLANQHWRNMGIPHFRIAVNISSRQFQDPKFASLVQKVLDEINLSPSSLELEITESMAMANLDHTFLILSELNNLGVHISIDDFGTGYSSLQYLKKFPIHTIKIDKSFVRDLVTDHDDSMIVKAICALGHGLNLQLVAEGVESLAQMEFLQSLNVVKMQGYFFSTPLCSTEFNALLVKAAQQGSFSW